MYTTRDPFNLRSKASRAAPSALSLLQTAATRTTQAVELTSKALQDADMNIESAQRRFEENVWNKVTGNEKGLPMYKDKPTGYGYGGGRGKPTFVRSKKGAVTAALVVLGLLYWLFVPGANQTPAARLSTGTGWFGGSAAAKKDTVWETRRQEVREAFLLSWNAYEEHGWGYDEYHPVAKTGRYMAEPNGMGWIIVDALDTMMIMNLTKELKHAREWVSTSLDYDKDQDVNTFETTIRMLGGLLSAHYLQETLPGLKPENSNDDDMFLEKATDLAGRLLGAYESPSGVPWASVRLKDSKGEASHADGGASSTAEATSLQLEMKYLAYLTGEADYWEKAEKVMQVVDDNGAKDGLVPIFIYADRGAFRGNEIRLGSRGDSYYEYLIKQYLQTQAQEPIYRDMWDETLRGVKKHLLSYTKHSHLTVLAERPSGLDGHLHPKMDHLVCFMPGTIALAQTSGLPVSAASKLPPWGKEQEENMLLAKELMKTCMGMYRATASGLSPEITHFELDDVPKMYDTKVLASTTELEKDTPEGEGWKSDFIIKPADAHNLQRPETVESLFYMWRITGDEVYREWGWEMFSAFKNHTRIEGGGGYTSVNDVTKVPPPSRDNMESFWLVSYDHRRQRLRGRIRVLLCYHVFPWYCKRFTDKHRPRHSSTSTSSSAQMTSCRSIRSY